MQRDVRSVDIRHSARDHFSINPELHLGHGTSSDKSTAQPLSNN
jgi:hypothetical protein